MDYNKMKFTSPEPLYAKVRETLKSYFDSGAIDDLLFPIWTEDALQLFRKSTLPIKEEFVVLKDYQANLPEGFDSAREVWLCTNVVQYVPSPNAIYYQKDCRVTTIDSNCNVCNSPTYDYVRSCDPCSQDYAVTHKITGETLISYRFSHLLQPGNINTRAKCADNCANLNTTCLDTFDIHDNKITTNFQKGNLHIIFYAKREDIEGEQLIPEDKRLQNFIQYFIFARCFEQLWHNISDESSSIIEKKFSFYQKKADDAYLDACVELKRETKEDIIKAIIRTKNRYNSARFR